MSENTDPLLPREAEKASAIVPGIGVRAFGLGEDSQGFEIGKLVERDGLGEREQKLSRLEDLHGNQWSPREPLHVSLQCVRFLAEVESRAVVVIGRRRAVRSGRFWGVDSERSIGAAEEELGTVGFDGFDLGRAISEKLERIVRTVNHFGDDEELVLVRRRFGAARQQGVD